MDENAVAEEEQRAYKVQGKEETQALRITNQHLKYITEEKEISRLQDMITMARYLMQNDEETKEKEAERLSRQMELSNDGDEEARKHVSDEAEVKSILEDDGTKLE